jgi:signal peptidase I
MVDQPAPAGESAPPTATVPRDSRIRGWLRHIGQGLLVATLALASYFGFSHFVLQSVQVVGRSMMPTLHDTERCLLNRWVYHFRSPHPGDIVVLRDPTDQKLAVKRIVATAGDTVLLKDGKLHVNGQVVQEPYLRPGTPTFPYLNLREQSFHCGPGQFLVLGDNRTDSSDSRTYGLISRKDILGLIVQ